MNDRELDQIDRGDTIDDALNAAASLVVRSGVADTGRLAARITGTGDDVATDLTAIRIARRAELDPIGFVYSARKHGASWSVIGEAAGTTRQSAHERWAHDIELMGLNDVDPPPTSGRVPEIYRDGYAAELRYDPEDGKWKLGVFDRYDNGVTDMKVIASGLVEPPLRKGDQVIRDASYQRSGDWIGYAYRDSGEPTGFYVIWKADVVPTTAQLEPTS